MFTFAAVSVRHLLRFLNARPLTLAPALLLLLPYLLYRKKYGWALLVSALYFYWHSATFFFPLLIAAIYFLVQLAIERKLEWKIIIFPFLGIGLAYLSLTALAPGFLEFTKDVTFGVIYRTIVSGQETIAGGTELYPVNYLTFIRPNIIILILLIMAWAGEWYAFRTRQKNTVDPESNGNLTILRLTLMVLTLVFLIGTFLVRRNSDYFIFFAGAYLAVAASFLSAKIQFPDSLLKKILTGGVLTALLFLFIDNLGTSRYLIVQTRPHELIAPTANWLKAKALSQSPLFKPVYSDQYYVIFEVVQPS